MAKRKQLFEVDANNNISNTSINRANKKNTLFEVSAKGKVTSHDTSKEKKKNGFFQGSKYFDDGYDFGDVLKTTFWSGADLLQDVTRGFSRTIEGTTDTLGYLSADVLDFFGADDTADWLRDVSKYDVTGKLLKPSDYLEQRSVFGNYSDTVFEGVGNVGGMIVTNTVMPGSGATSTMLTSFSSAYGNSMSEALRNGQDLSTARKTAFIHGTAEAISEQFFSGLPGLKTENWGGKVVGKIGSGIEKYFGTNTGKLAMKILNTTGEGFEEIISNMLTSVGNDFMHWIDKDFTYGMEGQSGNALKDAWKAATSKESWDSFISASLTSALTNGGNQFISNTQKNNLIKSYAKENNMTVNQAKTMFNQSVQQKAQSEMQKKPNMDLGQRVETENMAKAKTMQELKRGTFVQPGTESQTYQYAKSENQKVNDMNQSIVDAGGNNTQANKEAAATAKRLIEDLGFNIKFTNNQQLQEQGQNVNGRNINGFVKDGTMYLNLDSDELANFTIGHETKHFFEANKEMNDLLNQSLKEYAQEKGIWDKRLAETTELYTDKDGNLIGDPEGELLADLTGEVFSNYEFVNNLSVKNPSLFEKVRSFFQNLYYKATGQKEKLLIKQINDNLNKVYREYAKTQPKKDISSTENQRINDKNIQYSISQDNKEQISVSYAKQRFKNNIEKYGFASSFEDAILHHNLQPNEIESLYEYAKKQSEYQKQNKILLDNIYEQYKGEVKTENKSQDNQGRELTKEQQEYFKDSKVRDDEGRLLEVYHGTNYDFNEFKNPSRQYNDYSSGKMFADTSISMFTNSQEVAQTYIDNEESPNKKPMSVYLNMTNPYIVDANYQDNRYFFDNDGKPTNVNNLVKRIYDSGDYDGIIIKNVADVGNYYDYDLTDGKQYANDYIVFNSNQIKNVDNTNPTESPDIRYSLSPKGEMVDNETGEKVTLDVSNTGNTGNLMAIHNLNESKLKGILELGGFPVPSIAITTTENVGSNQFGDISVLFDKSTIDPAIAENEVYDRDVWSPTFPRVEYDIDNQMLRDLSKENNFYDNNEDDIISNARLNYLYSENLSDLVDRYGIDKTLDQMKNDDKLKYLYLKTMDNNYQPQMKPTKYSYDYSNETLQKYVDMYNQNKFNDMSLPDFYYHYLNYGDMKLTESQDEALKSTIRDIISEEYKQQAEQEYEKNIEKGNDLGKYKDNKDGFIENYVNMMLESYDNSYFKYRDFIKAASRLDEFGETQSIDESNTLKKVEEDINQKEYEKWIDDTFGNMLKNAKKGIRNDVDLFTPSGNRRSFDKLHENYDLQSVVRQMIKQKTVAGEEGFGAGSGFGTIQAQMSNQFNTLDEIREYANERIVPGTQEKDLTKPYADAIYSDMEELLEYYKFKDEKYSYPMDTVGYALNEFAGYKKQDLASLKRALNGYSFNTDSIPNELLNKVVKDVNSLKTLPTDYFEAKPQRAVGLDEIQQVVIPNDVNSEFKKQLQDKGIPYTEYDRTIDGDKQRVINQFDDLKFSLSQEGEIQSDKYKDLFPNMTRSNIHLSDLKRKEVELPIEEENALKTSENEQKEGTEKPTRREVIDRNRQLAREQLGDITGIKDKKRGILYQINTMKRNLRDIMSKEQAQKMYDTYFKDITTNNAKIENDITSYNERIQKYNLNDKESTYTQMIGELKHNPETTLTKQQVDDFYYKNANKIDQQKCENAVNEFRQIYDELIERVNDVLTDNGYKPIEYRKGYFPHFIEEKATSKLGKLAEKLGWKVKKGQLPTDIAGITDQFKPGKAWTSFSQQRTGDATDYNALKGLDNYLRGAMDVIHHTNDIQKLRALENEIRYQYSSKGIQEKINEIYADDKLDMDEKNEAIANLTSNIRESGLGNFVTEIRNYTDNLANKKAFGDRSMEQTLGRDVYSIMNNINGRVSANMVGANISSAITNFIPITQAWSQLSTKNLMRGMYESIKTSIKGDNFADRSTFLTNRTKQAERLYNTKMDKLTQKLGVPFEAIDSFTSNTIVRAKYYDNIAKGMTEQEAMANADEFAKDVMAGRSKGDQPTIFNRKNPLFKLFTAFQLEVNNQYGYMFKDIPTNMADEAKRKLVGAFIKMFLGAWLYNEITEKFTGRRAAFDPIDMAVSDVKTLTNENMDLGDKIQSIVKDTAQEVPFVSGLAGGGRLPIQGAIPYSNPLEMVTKTFEDIGNLDDPKKRKTAINNLKKEWSKPVYYLAFPVAGGQIKKTVEGLSMYDKDLPIAGSYTNSGKLRFEADTSALGKVQAAVFGQYASKNAREYFENGYSPLTEGQVEEALDAELPISEYREINQGIKNAKAEAKEKGENQTEAMYDYIYDLPIEMEQKNSLINSRTKGSSTVKDKNGYIKYVDDKGKTYWYDKKNDIVYNSKYKEMDTKDIADLTKASTKKDISSYGNYGSLAEFNYANKNPEKYLALTKIADYDTFMGYKDELAAIKQKYDNQTTEYKKQKVFEYINSLPLSIEQKLMLQKMGAGYSVKKQRGRLQNYIESLELTAEEKRAIDKVLFD